MTSTSAAKRVGFIGVGEQGWNNLLPALGLVDHVDLVAVCDADRTRLDRAARTYGAAAYVDFNSMLDLEQLDAVVVASHPEVHEAVLRRTIPSRMPTFIEKPPTLSTTALRDLVQMNEIHRTITSVGLNFGYSEPLQFVRAALAEESFGRLSYLRVAHMNNKPDDDLWTTGRRLRSFLLSQVIHALGVVFDFGQPLDDDESIDTYESDAGYLVTLRKQMTRHGTLTPFTAELVASSSSPYFDWSLQAVSDRGNSIVVNSLLEVEVYSHDQDHLYTASPKWWRSTWRPSPMSSGYRRTGYERQFTEFIGAIDGALAEHTIENALHMYEVMDRVEHQHTRIGAPVA
ncbi:MULTISPECIES: Gfo/Idh/MocA family protein [Microbacterium]|uniref:Gfo/Idh/MocA family protein n=1 Tax=Microbacterium TaxID=33882 RepID=UPI00249F4F4A|nr:MULTISPECIES: Gfo/Idh/MocA family oxidoreductase [Microbacterium]WHE36393.1 Gfo/Idh/MocA family oxidoreductase [Microbacterium sp. BDGP8]WJM15922.1 Gfo/Idh/MocA family oxidoreductase [Microbacterium arborescens]